MNRQTAGKGAWQLRLLITKSPTNVYQLGTAATPSRLATRRTRAFCFVQTTLLLPFFLFSPPPHLHLSLLLPVRFNFMPERVIQRVEGEAGRGRSGQRAAKVAA